MPQNSFLSPDPYRQPIDPKLEVTNTILLVDDDPDIRYLSRTFLQHENYTVLCCGDADRAAQIFRADPQHIDLLITDLYMPHRSGMDLAHELKALRQDLPILMISGGLIDTTQQSQLQKQRWSFLPKPFALPKLLSAVHRILNSNYSDKSSLGTIIRR
jgi:two-component system chemotaxis response regulator CheY